MKPWPVIDSRVIFEHPRLGIVEETVILPSGQQTGWLRIRDPRDSVCVICVDTDGRVLVAAQYNPPSRRVIGEFPGGGMEPGEAPPDAARRELMEEVGLYPHRLRAIGAFLPDNRRSAARQHVFVATDLEARLLPGDESEFITYEWLDPATIARRIRSGDLENGTFLAAWSLFSLSGGGEGR